MKRRDLLKYSAATFIFAVTGCGGASAADSTQTSNPSTPENPGPDDGLPHGSSVDTSPPVTSDLRFPQGIASGEPKPDSVILWTRVEASDLQTTGDVVLGYVLARDEALTDVVATGTVTARAESDYTVRLVPTGLAPFTHYYYRFDAGGVTTQVGRTKTAPAADADTPVTFAFAACQDYIGRYYHAWRALLEEPGDLDFVLFLGDYIYETVNAKSFQTTSADRAIALPDGMDTSAAQDDSETAAATLEDYRLLYKTYRADASLKEVHRRFPFVTIWDDHEFANDCWQDHSTYFDEKDPQTGGFTDEKNTPRREAASRAWFEYQPAAVVYDASQAFPNDTTIYRTLRYGQHVELFMTDQRSYRSDHVIPEGPRDLTVGKFTANSAIGSRMIVRKSVFDEREAQKRPTMLGGTQRTWFVSAVTASSATWKIWANEVQLWQQAVDLSTIQGVPSLVSYTAYVSADQWDGYRSERQDILTQLGGVTNLVACTGDIHAFYAAHLHADFDAPSAPVGVEFVTAAISSASLASLLTTQLGSVDLLKSFVPSLVANLDQAQLQTNAHLVHANSNAQGFARMVVTPAKVTVTYYVVGDPTDPTYGGVLSRQTFVTESGSNRIVLG